MLFRRPSKPLPEPNQVFPADAVVIVVPKVLLDRLFLLAIALALGSTVTIQVWNISGSNQIRQVSPKG
jgi:hypothetical protein